MTATDHRSAFYASYELAATTISAVTTADLSKPTACPEYDVATLVDHITGAAARAAALGRGGQPGPDEFPHVELADAPAEVRSSAKEAEAAWSDDSRLVATLTMPWGETYDGYTLVDMYLAELAAHTWDLAAALGRTDALGPALAGPALDAARAMLKPEYRNAMGKGNPFGDEVEAPPGASAWEQFAAFMGRDPRP